MPARCGWGGPPYGWKGDRFGSVHPAGPYTKSAQELTASEESSKFWGGEGFSREKEAL